MNCGVHEQQLTFGTTHANGNQYLGIYSGVPPMCTQGICPTCNTCSTCGRKVQQENIGFPVWWYNWFR
jgi:hypothetical protein